MNLQKLLLTKNDAYTEARKITPCGIFWHSTGANNPTLKRYVGPDDGKLGYNKSGNHWNRAGYRKCGHAMIGKLADGSIATYQTLPWNYRCMLSGLPTKNDKVKPDPRGSANDMGYIQFEICEDDTKNKDYAMAVYKEAVEFSAYILKMFNLDPHGKNRWNLPVTLDHAAGHQLGIASNHGDVLHWFGKYGITLAKIKQDIAKEMGQTPTPEPEPGKVPYKLKLTKGTPYYEKPDNKSKVNGKVEATTNYTIVEESGIYGKLKSGAGWVQLKDEQPTFKPYVVRVLSDVLNIRKEPTTQAAIVNTLRKNSAYTMVEERSGQGSTKGWGKLKSGAGWISLDFVEFVRYA